MGKLEEAEVRRWIRGHRRAEEAIRMERVRQLLTITPEESLRTYLSLVETSFGEPPADRGPSPLLTAVRKVMDRQSRRRDKT